jgi:hydrogenase maturation protease
MLSETIIRRPVPLHLAGVGNEFRKDDAAGLEIISNLLSMLGPAPAPDLSIHGVSSSPERLLSRLSSETGNIVIFDAVEASKEPGEVVFCSLSDTKYGFFATHNVPIRLIPGLAERERDIRLVGVQPGSLEVGVGLTEPVRRSVEQVVAVVAGGLGRKA